MANMFVRKTLNKWRICVDFTDLNAACPKDPYLLPNINHLIEGSSELQMLSFMDAY